MTIVHGVVTLCASSVLLGGAALGLGAIAIAPSPTADTSEVCATSGPLPRLTAAQAGNARTIAATAAARGGPQAELLALAVAITESNLLVLANPNDPSGNALPHQGVGSDHDSLGLFQQRPGWGSAAQRMDPVASTHLFLDALVKVPHWQSLPPAYVAQTVQRSAFTGTPSTANGGSSVVGGNYQAHVAEAAALANLIDADASLLDCGGTAGTALKPGGAGTHGLPEGYTIPAASAEARTAVAYTLAQLGKPYVWGGIGPNGFDCSGLTSQAWLHAGIPIGRVVSQQLDDGTATTVARLAPGDLVMVPGGLGSLAAPGHVGMYIGHGLVIAAPHTGDVVKVVTYTSFVSGGLSALRHIG